MIIIFSSEAYENITMFGNVAERLIKIMGHEVKNGVIKSENISQALTRLQSAIDTTPPEETHISDDKQNDDSNETPVSLAHRALPLIEMLVAAKKEKCEVTWKLNN